MKEYVVYEDKMNASPTKIHNTKCYNYKNHLQRITYTSTWHGPYLLKKAIDKAQQISKNYTTGWKWAECCLIKNHNEKILTS